MFTVPVVIEVLGLVAGALSGALHGMRHRVDLIGMCVLSLTTSLGGGLLRDVLIGQGPPVAMREPRYLMAVVCAVVIAVVLASWLARIRRILQVVDALLLGLWVAMGSEKALLVGLPISSAIFLGVVTPTGGGLMRDLLTGERPQLVSRGELHVTVAVIAAVEYVILRALPLPVLVGELVTIGSAATLRLLAMAHHWQAPGPFDLARWWKQRRSARSGAGQGGVQSAHHRFSPLRRHSRSPK
jgi:uncharacterized membrane protein YeiH